MGFLCNHRLTDDQLDSLNRHKYSAKGKSLTEPIMQQYWQWLVTKVPLWVAPNLLTVTGFIINTVTVIPLLLLDPNLQGHAPSWLYLMAALGFFIYQSLDAIDGKQARRTGSANQLGELFDHGCDALSMYFVLTSGASAVGLHSNLLSLLLFVGLLFQVTFVYHWQAFVCGTLHFNLFDVTEGEFTSIALLVVRGVCGLGFWDLQLPVLNYKLKPVLIFFVVVVSFLNLLKPFYIIMTQGAGKNGTTVANTSVLSPLVTTVLLVPPPFIYFSDSPDLLTSHSLLFVSATSLPMVKATIFMILANMTKSPYPLCDPLYVAPWLLLLNLYLGSPLPQVALFIVVMIWEVADIFLMSVMICLQVADYLKVPIFTLPSPPTSHQTPSPHSH